MEPVRTCVGCRSRAPKSTLLRLVAQEIGAETLLVADETATLDGRGAWLHPTLECFTKALQRHAFGRALRTTTALETSSLENRLKRQVNSHE
jgi:predicted RNA-binding protein YlxR (DUF448 family)